MQDGVQQVAADTDDGIHLGGMLGVGPTQGGTAATKVLAALALLEQGVLRAQQIHVVQHLDDGGTAVANLVPGRYRPAGQVVAHHQVRFFPLQHLAQGCPHRAVVLVAKVPAEARQRTGALLGQGPVEILQPGAIDANVVHRLLVHTLLGAGHQHGDLVAALLEAFHAALQDELRASAHMGRIEAVEKEQFHSG